MALNFNQCATLLKAINEQATGKTTLTPTTPGEFVSVATTTLMSGYDNVINAVSQVLSKTIFSVRPYNAKMEGLMVDSVRYGNHVRKLVTLDADPETDDRLSLTDGASVDQQRVKKPAVLQTNFYGANVYQRSVTIFRDQLDTAFTSAEEFSRFVVDQQRVKKPAVLQTNFYGANVYQRSVTIFRDQLDTAFTSAEEFSRFVGMVIQNVMDQREQDIENCKRLALNNFIAGKIQGDTDNVVHLLTEYKAESGLADLTAETVLSPANYPDFIKFAIGRIKTVGDLMTERSIKYHLNTTDAKIPRHTPLADQRVYLLSQYVNKMEASVFSTVFNEDYLKTVDFERINFWQSLDAPASINITPSYMHTDGTIKKSVFSTVFNEDYLKTVDFERINFWQSLDAPASINITPSYMHTDGTIKKSVTAVKKTAVFGVVFDREAVGMTMVNEWSAPAPFNARGGYTNTFWHYTTRYWNDFTENGVVFLLD